MTGEGHAACREMILLLQAEMDGQIEPLTDAASLWHRRTCPECRAALDVVEIARAMGQRLDRHRLPGAVRLNILRRLRAELRHDKE